VSTHPTSAAQSGCESVATQRSIVAFLSDSSACRFDFRFGLQGGKLRIDPERFRGALKLGKGVSCIRDLKQRVEDQRFGSEMLTVGLAES
jgi:hypothetical protein